MHTGYVTTKGRITIPAELRKKLGVTTNTQISWTEDNGRLVLTPVERLLDEIQGFLKPRPGERSAFEALLEERKRGRR
jgi:AbrB family looped-hinge helix DNA binding protein